MTKLKFIIYTILTALSIHGCSKILEPVSFEGDERRGWMSHDNVKDWINKPVSTQEEFSINIKGLTFNTAQNANKSPYPRQLMLAGSGSNADVVNEEYLLANKIPHELKKPDYFLGTGDELIFTQMYEVMPEATNWPTDSVNAEYLVGVGDELTLIQLNEGEIVVTNIINGIDIDSKVDDGETKKKTTSSQSETVIQSSGIVGTKGNILLLGLGSIKAVNRTLDDIRTEVRNILIRNGLAPSFQLEITKFKSKKAFVIGKKPANNATGNTIPITNLPLTLREVMVNYGFRQSGYDTTIINLTRDTQKFRMTVGQLFNLQTPNIFIQDKDKIEIDDTLAPNPEDYQLPANNIKLVRVGSQGNILLPGVGSIKAINRTLTSLHKEIYNILRKKGLAPKFQLELTKFESSKAYLISEGSNNKVINITDSGIHIKELILSNGFSINSNTSLSVVTLTRRSQVFRMTTEEIFAPNAPNLWIKDQDQIEVTNLDYKRGQVFALGGAGNAKIVTIDPSKRETLADILFVTGGALSNVLAKRSEVYLLRGRNPSVAYHLDAQNVSRILVAAQTELRPNDIVFVADRPIISFSRTLAELNPLRILLRDLENGNIP